MKPVILKDLQMHLNLHDVTAVLKLADFKKIKQTSKRITCQCPFAKYTNVHKHGDSNPSFVILQGDQVDETLYTCTCHQSGKLSSLFHRLSDLAFENQDVPAGARFDDCAKAVKELLQGNHLSPKATRMISPKKISRQVVEYPLWQLNKFPPVVIPVLIPHSHLLNRKEQAYDNQGVPLCEYHIKGYEYLLSRGIDYDMMVEYDIRVDEKFCMVVFPHYSADGRLAGMRGRSWLTDDDERIAKGKENGFSDPATKHYCYTTRIVVEGEASYVSNQGIVWFLADRLVNDALAWKNCPTIVVESAIDAILIRCSATAMLGCAVSEDKYAFFKGSAGIAWLGDSKGDGTDEDNVAKARVKAREACKALGIPYRDLYYPVGFKDLGDMAQKNPILMRAFLEDFYCTVYNEYLAQDQPQNPAKMALEVLQE